MMRKMLFILALLFFYPICSEVYFTQIPWGGRLGDQLLMYAKARWLCKRFNGSMRMQHFAYADKLKLWQCEPKEQRGQRVVGQINKSEPSRLNDGLYRVSYWFKASGWDDGLEVSTWHDVWQDDVFRNELKELIAPVKELSLVRPPEDVMSVAVHVRRGGGFDLPLKHEGEGPGNSCTAIKHSDIAWPLKFPPLNYYIEQIKWLSEYYDNQQMYVHIFTDDKHPEGLMQRIQQAVGKANIEYGCRQRGNSHNANVLEDFFSLPLFDCLIRTASNFAQVAQLIADYDLVIYPKHAQWQGDALVVDEVGYWSISS